MADDTEELLLENEVEETDEQEEQEEQNESQQEPEGNGEEEFEISFGDEAAPASESDTPLIKHLRNQLRETQKELQEAKKAAPQAQQIEVGEKPTLAGCDYDEEAFEQELEGWRDRKAKAEAAQANAGQAEREAREAWERDLQSYRDKRSALKFADVEEVEEVATSALNEVQQAVIVKAADNPALVLYSLGKHPARLAELSKITDPLKMAAAVAKLEGGLKVTARRKAPEPEEIASGSARVSGSSDKTLERLEKEAARTGDRTKLIQYKKSLSGGK